MPTTTAAPPAVLGDEIAARFRALADGQAGPLDARTALRCAADACRDVLARRFARTQAEDAARGRNACRRVHYLSMEFLIGRALGNALAALDVEGPLRAELAARGLDLADALEAEPDAALGNGGLGRLAACFLDAFAELGLPAFGYGLRYRYGMFAQSTPDGRQAEAPDDWLRDGSRWEFERPEVEYTVCFGGRVESDRAGGSRWVPAERVVARAFDFVVPAHHGERTATLRQWHARPERPIDFEAVCRGDYAAAARDQVAADALNWVLYP
ncbi:MAG: glycogen/starch/alpha-glucan phosphorylase, partial [Pseudomonadota bacterium]